MPALLGRYELVRPIAQGGMATVYLARVVGEGGFERLVALKLMHSHIAGEQDFVSMFLDEARLAARIRHPNVVPTLAVERGPEGLFLVMEYVDGLPLNALIRSLARERRPLPVEIVLRIMIDTLEGLHAAHELVDDAGAPLHLVHRDVSPQNVLVGKDGVSRITDFGVAHARSRLVTTQGSALKGKVAYLSPEQIASGTIDRRSDLFAAGIVLWEALALRRLFRGETEGQTMAQVLAGPKHAPHEVNPAASREVSEVCMHALATHPNERFQTALEMIDALENAARHAGVAIARPRDVGAFMATVNVPEPSLDGGKLPSSSGISAFGSRGPATGSAMIPIVASTPAPAASSKRRALWLALGGAGAIGLVVVTAVIVSSRSSAAEGPRGTAVAVPAAAAPGAGSVVPTAAPAPTPAEVAPSAELAPSAVPPPSAAAPASKPRKSVPEKAPVERPKGGAGYRPDEL